MSDGVARGGVTTDGVVRDGVVLESLTKTFGAVTALRDVDLQVEAGELVSLVGPSGSGKSTILRLVAGLERPDSGRILVDGRDVADVPPHRRSVAMVFQDYALYPHMTVRENLAFGLRVRKVARATIDEQVHTVAERLDIGQLLDRHPDEMSGGQRQRVALARAMIREPSVHLLDEPLASLDAQLRVATRWELLELHRRLGATTLHVTHDQAEAMTLADRVAVLDDGHLLQVGPPQEVYDQPSDVVVATFLGSPAMNIVPGGGVLGGTPAVTMGIRPEDLAVDPDGPLAAHVVLVESLGNESVLQVATASGTRLLVRTGPRTGLRPADAVHLRVDETRLHRFDATTGRRL